jgi:hypothetical protein
MSLKQDVHDRLWQAFQRWEEIRQTGVSKHDLKMHGIRECGDSNRFTRSLIFTGNTLRSYEAPLKDFVEFARQERGASRLEDIGKNEFREFMDRAIGRGLAVKTLNRYRSALAKFGALTGQTQSFATLSRKYGWKIRALGKQGQLPSPTRATPSREVLERAIAILRDRDARHFARTGEARGYSLAARLQLETAARSVSVTSRLTIDSLRTDCQVALIGKGGKEQLFKIPADLHSTLKLWFAHNSGPLTGQRGYQSAYARAMGAAGGHVTGTHGARRRSARDQYADLYRKGIKRGLSPGNSASEAAGDAIQLLGHSRHRRDHRSWYLDR